MALSQLEAAPSAHNLRASAVVATFPKIRRRTLSVSHATPCTPPLHPRGLGDVLHVQTTELGKFLVALSHMKPRESPTAAVRTKRKTVLEGSAGLGCAHHARKETSCLTRGGILQNSQNVMEKVAVFCEIQDLCVMLPRYLGKSFAVAADVPRSHLTSVRNLFVPIPQPATHSIYLAPSPDDSHRVASQTHASKSLNSFGIISDRIPSSNAEANNGRSHKPSPVRSGYKCSSLKL